MLQGKVILITGASRGIGEAIAHAAVAAGARVVLASRKQADLDRVASALGDHAVAYACHTGKADEVDALFAKAVDKFGRVDGAVNNAATNPYFGPLIDTPDAAIDKTFEVNVRGYLYVARAFVKHARARGGGGAIVNVASVAGMRAAPMQGIYGATKAAVISMTQTLAFELRRLADPRQRHRARSRRDKVRRGDRRQPDVARSRRRPHAARPACPASRDRRGDRLLVERCRVVHHRHDGGRRRRPDGGLRSAMKCGTQRWS